MSRRTRPLPRLRITVDLTGTDLERCREIAERQGTTIEDTIRQAIDLAMLRGWTR